MNCEEYFDLTIKSNYFSEILHWPVLRRKGDAILVSTSGGDAWLPLFRFKNRTFHTFEKEQLHNILDSISKTAADSLVRVKKAGKGPTEMSHKCRVEVSKKYGHYTGCADPHQTKVRTVTVPASLLIEKNGMQYVPLWNINQKINKDEYATQARSLTISVIREAIQAVVSRLEAKDDLERIERESRTLALRHDRNAELEIETAQRKKTDEDKKTMLIQKVTKERLESALEFCRQNMTIKEIRRYIWKFSDWPELPINLDHLPTLVTMAMIIDLAEKKYKLMRKPDRIITKVRVEWVDWAATSASKKMIVQSEECCTVKFYGKKRTIIFKDGDSIDKMDGPNLRIFEDDPFMAMSS